MALIGRALLILALLDAAYGFGASIYGARTGRREWVQSGRRAVYALAGLATAAFVILESAFLRSDFSYNVVAAHSSTTTPLFYKMAAPWASQEGSLLLWVWLLSLWSSLVLFLTRKRVRDIAPYATAVLLAFGAFFTSLAIFYANPFSTTGRPPTEGSGLDPLLLHPSMMIHPPMLYSGYTLLTIPFAFAVGALITGRLGSEWIAVTRRFALAAWLFLGIGILLGARWSYTELGWGGYWSWDPVENAALMPWLCITAFIHSIMIQEKRGMLKVWNASLVLGAGVPLDPGDVPGPLRHPQLDPRLRRLDAGRAVRGAAGVHGPRRRGTDRVAPRAAEHGGAPQLAALPRGRVPVPEPRAGGDGVRRLLDHVLPADLRGGDRDQGLGGSAGVPPVHRPAGPDPGAALGDRAAHRLAPRDRGQPAAQLHPSGAGGRGDARDPARAPAARRPSRSR